MTDKGIFDAIQQADQAIVVALDARAKAVTRLRCANGGRGAAPYRQACQSPGQLPSTLV